MVDIFPSHCCFIILSPVFDSLISFIQIHFMWPVFTAKDYILLLVDFNIDRLRYAMNAGYWLMFSCTCAVFQQFHLHIGDNVQAGKIHHFGRNWLSSPWMALKWSIRIIPTVIWRMHVCVLWHVFARGMDVGKQWEDGVDHTHECVAWPCLTY